jgi:uncharacterized membrane protein
MELFIWSAAWIIIPFIIGLVFFGVGWAIGLAILGVLAYFTQRLIVISRQQKKYENKHPKDL